MPAAPRTTLTSFASLAWFVVMTGLAGLLWLGDVGEGGPGLVSADHRPPMGTHVRLSLRVSEAEAAWAQIVDHLGPRLPGHRPLAPPPTEASAWRGAHTLYLHGAASAARLAERLEPTALRDTVAGWRARLASPLFVVGEDDLQRDPLGLVDNGVRDAEVGPFVTASGDLMSADGRTLLVYLRTTMPPMRLHAWISAQLASRFGVGSGIDVRVLPITANTHGGSRSVKTVVDLLAAGLAGLVLVLALGLRRVRTALVLVLAIGVGTPLVVLLAGGMDSLVAPLMVAMFAVVAGLAGPVAGGAVLGSALRGATALLPLLLLPYPAWQRWALVWLLGVVALTLVLRWVAPALLRWTRARAPGVVGSSARPWPRAAALGVCVALLAGGTWSFGHVSGDILVEGPGDDGVGEFFRPARLAELRSVGDDGAEALASAADDAAELQALRPATLGWVDLPGALVVGEDGCAARYAELKPLDLPGRVEHLRDLLAAQGLRADAFAEALRGLDPERQPTPEEALGGPLAGWFTAHLEPDDEKLAAISRVELRAGLDDAVELPAGLRGPAVFEQQERRARASRLGVALVVGTWLSAFLTWLTARRLSTAITAGLIAGAAQAGALLVAVLAGFTAVTLLLPPLLLVGALAADGAARACRPVPEDSRPGLALACVLAPALVLVASAEPAWRGFGLVLGCGAALGFTLASRAAPGLCALLRRGEGGAA